MTALRTKLRWRVAGWLNLLPGQCWADLVSWALRSDGYRLWSPQRRVCLGEDTQRNGQCYCGKVRAR